MFNNLNYTYTLKYDPITMIETEFNLKFNPISRPLLSWRDEVFNTARNIGQLADKPIGLWLSGGIDSEVIARTFLELGINFTAISFRHSEGTNDHDLNWARKFCLKNKIEHTILNFDVDYFFNTKIQEYINMGIRSPRVWRYFQLFMIETSEKMGKCGVLGSGEQLYKTIDGKICLQYKSDLTIIPQWCEKNNVLHFPYFYQQNSEVFASYIKTDLIDCLLSCPDNFVNVLPNGSLEKMMVIHRYWPEIERRRKFDGFEQILELKNKTNNLLKEQFNDIKILRMPISDVKEQLNLI
jgi:hypothetical protein